MNATSVTGRSVCSAVSAMFAMALALAASKTGKEFDMLDEWQKMVMVGIKDLSLRIDDLQKQLNALEETVKEQWVEQEESKDIVFVAEFPTESAEPEKRKIPYVGNMNYHSPYVDRMFREGELED
jgi:hypothetical protein